MKDRARNVYEMFIRILAFHLVNAADYAALAIAAVSFAEVQAAADAMEVYFTEQQSGDVAVAVELKAILRGAIKRKMTPFRKTAKAMAQTDPGIDKSFLPFHSVNDATLVAIGRDYFDTHAAKEAAFTALGLPKQKRFDLAADLDSFEAALTSKATAQQGSVGATTGIDVKVESGMSAAEVADAVMKNFYFDNPEKLAEWKTARHVKRAAQADDPPTP